MMIYVTDALLPRLCVPPLLLVHYWAPHKPPCEPVTSSKCTPADAQQLFTDQPGYLVFPGATKLAGRAGWSAVQHVPYCVGCGSGDAIPYIDVWYGTHQDEALPSVLVQELVCMHSSSAAAHHVGSLGCGGGLRPVVLPVLHRRNCSKLRAFCTESCD